MAEKSPMLGSKHHSDNFFCPAAGKQCLYDNPTRSKPWWSRASHQVRRRREERFWLKDQLA